MKKISELEIRQKIFALINNNPGLHGRKIARIIGVNSQLADYHLHYLEVHNVITSVKKGRFRRYFIKGEIGTEDKKLIFLLRQSTPLKIVLFLIKNPGSRQIDILKLIKISKSTLSYHIKRLLDADILYESVTNNEKTYFIKNEEEIVKLLVRFKPFDWIDNFTEGWKDFLWK